MDNDLFEKGLAQRKATLGAEYVEKNLAAADDFSRPFQEAMTAWCWGFGAPRKSVPSSTWSESTVVCHSRSSAFASHARYWKKKTCYNRVKVRLPNARYLAMLQIAAHRFHAL